MDGAAPLGGLATSITSAVWESSARDLLVPAWGSPSREFHARRLGEGGLRRSASQVGGRTPRQRARRLRGSPLSVAPGIPVVCERTLLLPRIVRWIHVVDRPRAYTMNLNFGFLASPGEVIGFGLHDCDAAWG